jgi:hypothetical protein
MAMRWLRSAMAEIAIPAISAQKATGIPSACRGNAARPNAASAPIRKSPVRVIANLCRNGTNKARAPMVRVYAIGRAWMTAITGTASIAIRMTGIDDNAMAQYLDLN